MCYILKEKATMKSKSYNKLVSEAGEKVLSGVATWTNYPRPQLKRDNWILLQDGWKLNNKEIRMPFPPQSLLSGYNDEVDDNLTYMCEIGRLENIGMRTLLHFGAVDQVADVYLNGSLLGRHEGGYLPFTFEITDALEDNNRLIVDVKDTLNKMYPYGKQTKKRGGMWYTPVSGIWQNVWIERVPQNYIENIKITPDDYKIKVKLTVNYGKSGSNTEVCKGLEQTKNNHRFINNRISVELHNGEIYEMEFEGDEVTIDMSTIRLKSGDIYNPVKWSTDNPYLYSTKIIVGDDVVETYFALRKIDIQKINGISRVCLNDKPIFLNGVLDQGYFCDGIFLPAEEKEYERDILRMKKLGMNMLRKHIKIEPECFYYYCDLHGMLVVQDIVNNGSYSFLRDTALPTVGFTKRDDTKFRVDKSTKEFFEKHMIETLDHLYNHPCIVAYTIFNEGWGQFDSDKMYALAKTKDNTRLYDSTSGWFWQKDNDFDSYHVYFNKKVSRPSSRPLFISEFGGFTYAVSGHMFSEESNYGYGVCKDRDELISKIIRRYEELIIPIIKLGACGAVYTQLSDVEDEINGFYTYDRRVCKVDEKMMQELADRINNEMECD